jgi:hypothetical protein
VDDVVIEAGCKAGLGSHVIEDLVVPKVHLTDIGPVVHGGHEEQQGKQAAHGSAAAA